MCYQRNVGILEKIVQSLTSNTKALQHKELEAQYRAQMDVLEQLQDKIMKLLQQQSQTTAVTKLQRDFERVKQRVTVIEDGVERILKSQKQQLANKSILENAATPETAEDSYQLLQLQMQQDVSCVPPVSIIVLSIVDDGSDPFYTLLCLFFLIHT